MCASIMRIQPSNKTSSRMAQLYRITETNGENKRKRKVAFQQTNENRENPANAQGSIRTWYRRTWTNGITA